MTTTLIVLAHPEPASFNGAWARATARASQELGHEVLWSDLTAMGFDPAERAALYPQAAPRPFDPLKAQEEAAAGGTLPADIRAEAEKIRRADRIVLHFPIWWFAPPAILKGWCDRALVHGLLHTVDERFDTGLCRDKTVLFCATTGSSAVESAPDGKEGDIRLLLWPLAYTFRYLGMRVLEPRTIHGVHGYFTGQEQADLQARLQSELAAHADIMREFDSLPAMGFNPDTDFDDSGRLRPASPSHSPFIRHDN
jgi:NAD(P)H dehydrogenase (quinone)